MLWINSKYLAALHALKLIHFHTKYPFSFKQYAIGQQFEIFSIVSSTSLMTAMYINLVHDNTDLSELTITTGHQ